MKVRIVRIQLNTGEYETIATSLDREKFPPERIKDLYHKKWGIETSFRELKYSIGVTNFHAKKQKSVLQEIFARLIMYNFCERITLHVVIENDKGIKWQYQATLPWVSISVEIIFVTSRQDRQIQKRRLRNISCRFVQTVLTGVKLDRNQQSYLTIV